MRNDTRLAYNAYTARIAELNGVPEATVNFTVEPTIAQTLEDKIRESADFLRQINIYEVDEAKAAIIGLDTSGPAAGRTNTTRVPTYIGALTGREYECVKTNFDTCISYALLDQWAKFPDFQIRMRNAFIRQIARDRLMIGCNGTHAAAVTNKTTYPLLQDTNIGWLQHIRVGKPEHVLTGIKIGTAPGADYRDIDAAANDMGNLLADWYEADPDIIAITGRSLVSDKYTALMQADDSQAPSEREALRTMALNKTVGGRRASVVPFFPAKSLLLTKPKNLSIYTQKGSHRRAIIDNPANDRIDDFASDNEAYVVEDFDAAVLLDGILTWNETTGEWE